MLTIRKRGPTWYARGSVRVGQEIRRVQSVLQAAIAAKMPKPIGAGSKLKSGKN